MNKVELGRHAHEAKQKKKKKHSEAFKFITM